MSGFHDYLKGKTNVFFLYFFQLNSKGPFSTVFNLKVFLKTSLIIYFGHELHFLREFFKSTVPYLEGLFFLNEDKYLSVSSLIFISGNLSPLSTLTAQSRLILCDPSYIGQEMLLSS